MASSSASEQTAEFLWTLSKRLSSTCPALSRYYICSLERKLITELPDYKKGVQRKHLYCNHCGNLWAPGNHRVRIVPPPAANCHIKKLLQSEASEPWKLNSRQKKKLKIFRNCTSKIIYTCNICHKITTYPGIMKYRRKEISKPSFTTPVLKIKGKKGNLNAGLYIKTPSEKQSQDTSTLYSEDNTFLCAPLAEPIRKEAKNTEDESFHSSPKSNSKIKKAIDNRFITKHVARRDPKQTPNSISSPKTLSSQKKKKKSSLLAQILNEEKSSTKKNNLASFLISL